MTKIFAHYLPQFHEIEENNQWWGKGFTEWNNVRNAIAYSNKQIQPRLPYNGNYYDLSKIEDIEKQVHYANQYGLDGFCFYHYYSKSVKLLSKPAELFLANKNLKIQFFFSWANHDWRRTWASGSKEILLKQEYGSIEDIVSHYNYLRNFFMDERYYKIDNKPVFMLYQNIPLESFRAIHHIFEQCAKKDGFDGIYWVGTVKNKKDFFSVPLDNYYSYEPDYSRTSDFLFILYNKACSFIIKIKNRIKKESQPLGMDYLKIIRAIGRSSFQGILGCTAGWDNTPRHKTAGYYYYNFSIDAFEKHLQRQLKKSISCHTPFMMINAWNEWGECAYLEPDERYKFGKLEAIKEVKNLFYSK